ncbi:MAG: S1/P1 nuclease [Candidatus Riflebacteria bacterium]|nr:S1/P1 nuclease [Candidatus Riflebacteria bacterium]
MKIMNRSLLRSFFTAIACVIISASLSTPLFAWGGLGHKLVARLAFEQMTPKARSEATKILKGASLESVSTWADLIKRDRPETASFHFVNFISQNPSLSDNQDVTNSKNVVSGIYLNKSILQNESASLDEKKEALCFLIHFVGDIHQPLHCAPDGNSGGNDIKVKFFNDETNLHKVWDSELIKATNVSEDDYFQALKNDTKNFDQSKLSGENCMGWAIESNKIAVMNAYSIPSDNVLEERYYEQNIKIVNRQLVIAGIRLAQMLNQIFEIYKDHGTDCVSLPVMNQCLSSVE